MRRSDRQVVDTNKIEKIIHSCHCCRLGFNDNGSVYIVPLNFGYEKAGEKRIFYFHSATEGRKIDLIKTGAPVGFELDTSYALRTSSVACGYTASFQSVIGMGNAFLIENPDEKIHALTKIMLHYTGKSEWSFPAEMLAQTAVFRLEVTELCCKEHE